MNIEDYSGRTVVKVGAVFPLDVRGHCVTLNDGSIGYTECRASSLKREVPADTFGRIKRMHETYLSAINSLVQ